ncbi:Six-bladed beta-propeller, TolB-like protein [Corchorus olitorius]|uniref:Six-bladed beta-propeller, TolB-like protein n=1 Tax=Corchorus olitorius TaxID=93759 RepID=A0A1R3KN06_9ROSI|nr:Six-bladed beta-propeller, TolB-like protein [Corchorus olitorius]
MSSKLFLALTITVVLYAVVVVNINHIPLPLQKHSVAEKPAIDGKRWQLEVVIPIAGAAGPESVAFDQLGDGPYTGISDGRIIKWQENERRWINFATTSLNREGCEGEGEEYHHLKEHMCGRPLGICFSEVSGHLYIADAYMGLLKVGPQGGLATPIATHAQGTPLKFTNSLDINQSDESIYFTDSTSLYQRRNYLWVILSGDKTARLMKYEQESKQVTVLLNNLSFPNGVALSKDGSFLVFAETSKCRIQRYWLKTSKAGTLETLAKLPGFPDNIKRSPRGGFWVAMHSRSGKILSWMLSYPQPGKSLVRLLRFDIMMKAYSVVSKYRGSGLAIRLSEDGEILEMLEDKVSEYRMKSMSEVQEKEGDLWIGSIDMPFVGMYRMY